MPGGVGGERRGGGDLVVPYPDRPFSVGAAGGHCPRNPAAQARLYQIASLCFQGSLSKLEKTDASKMHGKTCALAHSSWTPSLMSW